MERTHFQEAIQSNDALQAQSKEDWQQLAKEYPFSGLTQLLYARRKKTLSTEDLNKLLIHFDHPLQLSRTLNYERKIEEKKVSQKKEVEVSKETKEEAPVSETKESKKKTSRLTTIKPKKVEEAKPINKVAEAAPKVAEALVAKEIIEEVKTTPEVSEKDDVLELINELPEENPIKKEEKIAAPEKEVVAEEEVTEDPGDLMVMMSFTDWLHHFKAKSENEAEEKKGKDAIRSAWQKEKLEEAMDEEEDVVPDEIFKKAMKSVSFGDGLVTEPLAELYVEQGKTEKAIELYKKLSLLNPEKRTYFASRIKDLHLLK